MKQFIKIEVVSWESGNGNTHEANFSPEHYIEYYDAVDGGIEKVTFKITEQSHRGCAFHPKSTRTKKDFTSSSGLDLSSYSYPANSNSTKTLFVRGDDERKDEDLITVSHRRFVEIYKAINEYNELYNEEEKVVKGKSMKKIELEVIARNSYQVCFEIKEQTHRGHKFGHDNNYYFRASNGFTLKSLATPSYNTSNKSLCVLGENTKLDTCMILVNDSQFDEIMDAIKEYNEFFAEKREHKHILLEKLAENDGRVAFRIKEQTHRNDNFGGDSLYEFFASNGIRMASVEFPHAYTADGAFYVGGKETSSDNKVMLVPCEFFKKIEEAVKEYNNYWK